MFTKLTEKQLENKGKYIENYIKSQNAATGSIFDANANVSVKNIATLEAELNKDVFIQVNRKILCDKITELFSKKDADEYLDMLENRVIYSHDESSLKPYCISINMYPFLQDGLTKIGGESKAPTDIYSFCGSFINLMFAISSQFAGAVASVEWLMYMDKFMRQEFGDNYAEERAKELDKFFSQMVYSINQPAAARGYQSIFWNISIFDKEYFDSMFGDFIFPDFTEPKWETLDKLQRFFLKWINNERTKAVLTFPVITVAMLSENGKVKDPEYHELISEELSEGNSFFIYMSDNADSLASCCFDGSQEVLVKSSNNGVKRVSIKEWYETKSVDKKNNRIYHDGSWVDGKTIKLNPFNKKMFKVTTVNGKELLITEDHLNPTLRGDLKSSELTTNDYLMFNTRELAGIKKSNIDQDYTYEDGLLIGAYLGDGTIDKRDTTIESTILSLNSEKIKKLGSILSGWNFTAEVNKCIKAITSDKKVSSLIKRFVIGNYCYNKGLNLECLIYSLDFRKGILDGIYITDGGNSNRIYTTSQELSKDLEVLIMSIGFQSIIDVSDRTNEKVIIRGEEFNRNHPLYCVRFYDKTTAREHKDVFVHRMGNTYFKIKSIEEQETTPSEVFCFEMKNKDEPYFTLPNGIITHNCRLRNEVEDNTFSHSMGAGGVATGSINVITMNYNRIIQSGIEPEYVVKQIQKYHYAYRKITEELLEAGMLPVYDAGFITLDKQYNTIGINGMLEAAEYLGLEPTNNDDYKKFLQTHLGNIYKLNREARQEYGIMFNTEFVPAENLGVKNANWDKKDDLKVNRDCYNSYFYRVEDNEINMLDKFILHGEEINTYLDGGSALHLNLAEYPSKEAFKKILNVAAKCGCNYFTTNVLVTICDECGTIDKNTLNECPKCGNKDVDHATRIIGYLQRISKFSNARQQEADLRYYHKRGNNE